jgi:dsRNA-specific ribonuclease
VNDVVLMFRDMLKVTKEEVDYLLQRYSTREHRAKVAKELSLDTYINYCERQKGQLPSKKTLSLALSAVVAAIWKDCQQDFLIFGNIIRKMK